MYQGYTPMPCFLQFGANSYWFYHLKTTPSAENRAFNIYTHGKDL